MHLNAGRRCATATFLGAVLVLLGSVTPEVRANPIPEAVPTGFATTKLAAGEYFVGNDPGQGSGTALTPQDGLFDDESESSLPLTLDVSALAVGEHRIGVRYRDSAGNWSPVTWTDLVIYQQTPTAEAVPGGFATTKLAAGEYFE